MNKCMLVEKNTKCGIGIIKLTNNLRQRKIIKRTLIMRWNINVITSFVLKFTGV